MSKKILLLLVFFLTILFPGKNIQAEFKIILNFDDGYQGVYDKAYPLMRQYNIPGVLYVIVRTIGSENHLSLEQLRELKKAGWEIGSHTIHHSNLEMLTPQGLFQEIASSRLQLQQLGLIENSYASFCTPMSKWNQDIKKIAAEHYQIVRGKKLFVFPNNQSLNTTNSSSIPEADITSTIGEVIPKIVVQETAITVFQKWLEEAIEDNIPLVLVFHDIVEGGNEYSFPPEKFKEVINLIKDYSVITFQELYQECLTE